MRNMIASLRWGVAAAGIHVAFLAVFLLSACTDVGDRDNPLDPGASNYVAQFDTVQEIVQMSEDEALSQLIEDVKNGKVDTSDGLSQSLIDSIKSGAITADDLKKDFSLSSKDSKIIDSLTQKTIEDSRDTIEVVVPVSSSQKSESSSSKKGNSSSSVSSSESPEVVSSSSENVESSSSVFSVDIYLNTNISYAELPDERDGKVYKTVKIGEYTWMAQNLNFETENSYCYEDKPENCEKYGRLYTWAAAMDSTGTYNGEGKNCGSGKKCSPRLYLGVRGICPDGWHLPSEMEWNELIETVGGFENAGKMLKTTEISNNGSNDYGFSAVPVGRRNNKGKYDDDYAVWYWSSFENSEYAVKTAHSYNEQMEISVVDKRYAFGIRCLQDYEVLSTLTDDRDGKTYTTVKIGKQKWMAENLNYAYLSGTATEDSSSYCYENKPENCDKYGRFYLWSAAMDSANVFGKGDGAGCGDGWPCNPEPPIQGVCPNGWHLPSKEEWEKLDSYGGVLALKAKTDWIDGLGQDSYGFNALPAGIMKAWGCNDDGKWGCVGYTAVFCSMTESDYSGFESYTMDYEAYEYHATFGGMTKYAATSVRCIED